MGIERLKKHKRDRAEEQIETMERNRDVYRKVHDLFVARQIPGCESINLSQATRCITIRFIGMAVQWYYHTDMCHVHNGNAGIKKYELKPPLLLARLMQGRSAFING